jgi:hypothetical protein
MKKVISDEELIKFLISVLYNLNQWAWNFFLRLSENKFGIEGKDYIESLAKKRRI